jgi:uncharacterized protein (DUF3084 family)
MDLVSGLFLLAIVLLGGVIALLADWLGRTMGKKRLRFLHLRPRHTAALFTATAGMLIPVITILVVAAVSNDVRQWILEGRNAIRQAKELSGQRDVLQGQIERARQEVDKLKKEQDWADRKRRDLENRNASLVSKAELLSTDVSEARQGFTKAQTRLGVATNELKRQLVNLRSTQGTLKNREETLDRLDAQIEEVARQLNDVTIKALELDQRIVRYEREIKSKEGEIANLTASELEQRNRLDTMEKELSDAQSKLETARRDLSETKIKLQEGQAELGELQNQVQFLKAISDNSRTQRLVFAKGDEVVRIVVPANMANSAARNQMTRLLRSARVAAEALGAKGAPAAGFFSREGASGVITPDQQTSEIVSRIAGYPNERVLVARSLINTFVGEPVALEVDLHPSKKCFTAREVIAETRVDGDLPIAEIIRRISNLLTGEVRRRALAAGMVPIAGREDSLGSIDPDLVYQLVQQLKSDSRTARVQVLAAEDIMSGDPLKVEFRLR